MSSRVSRSGWIAARDSSDSSCEYPAFLRHYPGEVEAGCVDDGFRQIDGGLAGLHAVEPEEGVDVHGYIQADAAGDCGV